MWCEQKEIIYMFKNTFEDLQTFNDRVLSKNKYYENYMTIEKELMEQAFNNTNLVDIVYGELMNDSQVNKHLVDKFRVLFPDLNNKINDFNSNIHQNINYVQRLYGENNLIDDSQKLILLE